MVDNAINILKEYIELEMSSKGYLIKDKIRNKIKELIEAYPNVGINDLFNTIEKTNALIVNKEEDLLKYIKYVQNELSEYYQVFKTSCFEVIFNNYKLNKRLESHLMKHINLRFKDKDKKQILEDYKQEVYFSLINGDFDKYVYASELNVVDSFFYYILDNLQKAKRNIEQLNSIVKIPSHIIDKLSIVINKVEKEYSYMDEDEKQEIVIGVMLNEYPRMTRRQIIDLLKSDVYISDSEYLEKTI